MTKKLSFHFLLKKNGKKKRDTLTPKKQMQMI